MDIREIEVATVLATILLIFILFIILLFKRIASLEQEVKEVRKIKVEASTPVTQAEFRILKQYTYDISKEINEKFKSIDRDINALK